MGSIRDKSEGSRATDPPPCLPAGAATPGAFEFAPGHRSREKSSLSNRSIAPAWVRSPLAGVLLGKTSFNSLYGLRAGTRERRHGFGSSIQRVLRPATAPNE